MNGQIQTSIRNNIGTISFSHPASNSFPSVLLGRLVENINRLSDNDNVHVIVLKSEGDRAFCAGASFDELVAIKTLLDGEKFFSGFANVINAMRTCKKIIIGRVQGKAVGGGVGIVSACDYVFALESADIKLSELSIGIGPFVIEPAVERKIGLAAFSELTIDATHWQTAYWAQKKGLFNKVFEKTREMDTAIEQLASKLASYNIESLVEMKKIFWKNTEHWNDLLIQRAKVSGKLVLSDFTKNALQKFKK
ncbi:MAG TPA: enoyl-CoA hydratase/isomerase family protein [Flavobacteriaceae bacterium]|nr:enoyl-CoA hydratase/isomerase family protein [Flavobacteriaceae bacterium]HIP27191.1 enoyl-CoA hydratase/isomerase family protein [Flavobacteriaceae bacterium]